jgi:hypothetical protein
MPFGIVKEGKEELELENQFILAKFSDCANNSALAYLGLVHISAVTASLCPSKKS